MNNEDVFGSMTLNFRIGFCRECPLFLRCASGWHKKYFGFLYRAGLRILRFILKRIAYLNNKTSIIFFCFKINLEFCNV